MELNSSLRKPLPKWTQVPASVVSGFGFGGALSLLFDTWVMTNLDLSRRPVGTPLGISLLTYFNSKPLPFLFLALVVTVIAVRVMDKIAWPVVVPWLIGCAFFFYWWGGLTQTETFFESPPRLHVETPFYSVTIPL